MNERPIDQIAGAQAAAGVQAQSRAVQSYYAALRSLAQEKTYSEDRVAQVANQFFAAVNFENPNDALSPRYDLLARADGGQEEFANNEKADLIYSMFSTYLDKNINGDDGFAHSLENSAFYRRLIDKNFPTNGVQAAAPVKQETAAASSGASTSPTELAAEQRIPIRFESIGDQAQAQIENVMEHHLTNFSLTVDIFKSIVAGTLGRIGDKPQDGDELEALIAGFGLERSDEDGNEILVRKAGEGPRPVKQVAAPVPEAVASDELDFDEPKEIVGIPKKPARQVAKASAGPRTILQKILDNPDHHLKVVQEINAIVRGDKLNKAEAGRRIARVIGKDHIAGKTRDDILKGLGFMTDEGFQTVAEPGVSSSLRLKSYTPSSLAWEYQLEDLGDVLNDLDSARPIPLNEALDLVGGVKGLNLVKVSLENLAEDWLAGVAWDMSEGDFDFEMIADASDFDNKTKTEVLAFALSLPADTPLGEKIREPDALKNLVENLIRVK